LDGNAPVTKDLCAARHKTVDVILDSISRDGQETRAGVGELLRVVKEGNGHPSMVAQLQAHEDYIAACKEDAKARKEREEKLADERAAEKRRTRNLYIIAGAGWFLSLGGLLVAIVMRG
jgi:hypothetical protein